MRDLEQKVNRIMNRRSFKQWLSLPCLWTVALLTVQAQPVELEYAPDDGAVFNVVETVTRVTSVTGADPAVDPVTDVRMRESVVTIAAYVDPHSEGQPAHDHHDHAVVPESTAFSNNVAIMSQTLTRDGAVIASPLHAALSGLELTHHVDAAGNLLAIAGYEGVRDAMTAKLPDKLAATLLKLVNHETLRHQDRASYEEVHGPFTEGSVTPVANEVSAASHALPSEGSVVLYAVTTIAAVPDEDKIRLTRTFNSDAAALAMQFDGLEEATILEAQGMLAQTLPETYASATVSGSEEVLVQTSGALVESCTLMLVAEWTLQAPEGATAETHKVEETREFTASAVEMPAEAMTAAQP